MPTDLAGSREKTACTTQVWAGLAAKRLEKAATLRTVRAQQQHIHRQLRKNGVTFEGKRIDVALMPTVVSAREVRRVAAQGKLVRSGLEKLIAAFRHELRRGPGPLQEAFQPYRRWFGLIERERPRLGEIGLMRFDGIRQREGQWTFIETNTACAGGTTTCPILRAAWLTSPLGRRALQGARLERYRHDRPSAFVEFLFRQAERIAGPGRGNVAALNHRGDLTFEMDLWEQVARRLRESGKVRGRFLLGDVREVEVVDQTACLRGVPVALIHNKVDPLGIDPEDSAIQGWIEASRLSRTDFLNSFAAQFLTEAKRVLVLLQRPDLQHIIGLDRREKQAVCELLPLSEIVQPADRRQLTRLRRRRRQWVLKADALTRGEGVFMGNELTSEEWEGAIAETRRNFGVMQRRIPIPRSPAIEIAQGRLKIGQEHYGVELFYFAGQFAGIASRSHRNQIFNVGHGGKERAVAAIAEWPGQDSCF
ncbi:MAG TPA: hypothetical protein VLU25_21045 [Acidobacteriota bacterium]|nr:hypothetical protein [Acidobacteriota bacterium]